MALAAAALCGVLFAGCGSSSEDEPADASVLVELTHFNDPAGTASFEPISAARTRVVVQLSEPLARARVDVHPSSCLELGTEPSFELAPVIDGRSETELAMSVDELSSRDSSLWVHADAGEEDSVACGEFGKTPPPALAQSPRRAAEIAACYRPARGYGFERGACARVEKMELIEDEVWRLELRGPPLYCVEMHLDAYSGDARLDVADVGHLWETRCPATAYPPEPQPDLHTRLRPGQATVSLTAVGRHRTRVLVEADADVAWIRRGTCRSTGRSVARLDDFYSFRSVTAVRVPLRSLVDTPHALEIDAGGAHGGDPTGCADLSRDG